ncbi:hypothetical protein [Anditalea andensis]|nr:hypothetical protein [Anditalea andensis]
MAVNQVDACKPKAYGASTPLRKAGSQYLMNRSIDFSLEQFTGL